MLQSGHAAIAKVADFLNEQPSQLDAGPEAAPATVGPGVLSARAVRFRYPGSELDVLRGIDVTFRPGERVALVGVSGSGKSTLAKLLARLYAPTSGHVTLDGTELTSLSREALRARVILVPQEGYLFDGTVADNIRAARPDTPRAAIEELCRRLGIADALDGLPEGLDTRVRGGGSNLSAGQRQLVALARASIANAAVLILDEATSNVDPAAELAAETAIRHTALERTVVVIAHRSSTALRCDRVVLLADGRLAADGSPGELVANEQFQRWLASVDRTSAAGA
jgi:ABC-type multidrug transport system fused ATPase/permease subunit